MSLADISEAALKEAVRALSPGAHTSTVVDVRDSKQVTSWIEMTVHDHGPLNGAVNLAGIINSDSLLKDETDERFQNVMDINVGGVFNCLRAQLNNMVDSGGSIVSSHLTCSSFLCISATGPSSIELKSKRTNLAKTL